MVAESDAYVRALKAWEPWIRGDFWHLDFTDSWLPLHALILRVSLIFSTDPHDAPRILTFIVSSLGIPIFYAYVRSYFVRSYALLSTLLFTLFPLRLVLGTQTMSEGVFLPLFLLVVTAINNVRLNPQALSAALLGLSLITGIRYEGWFLLPYIWLNIWMRLGPLFLRVTAILLTTITPLWYLLNEQRYSGDILTPLYHKITIAHMGSHPEYFDLFLSLQAVASAFMKTVPLPYLALAAIGFFTLYTQTAKPPPYSTPKKEPLLLTHARLLLPLFFLTTLLVQVYLGTMEWIPARYFLITATLLIGYLPAGMVQIYKVSRAAGVTLILAMLLLLPSYMTHQYAALTSGLFHRTANTAVLTDFMHLTQYLTEQPRSSYRYIRSEYLHDESYVIALSYFLTDPEIIKNALLTPSQASALPTSPPVLIVEKPIPDILLTDSAIHYENEFFAVITHRPPNTSE